MTTCDGCDLCRIGHDPDVFEACYREHLEAVQRFDARRVDDPHLAADLTADVFLAAIDGTTRERQAVGRISGRRLLDAGSQARIEDRLDAERAGRRLHAALAALPPQGRALMELVALDGLPVTEAAAVLGMKGLEQALAEHGIRAEVDYDAELFQAEDDTASGSGSFFAGLPVDPCQEGDEFPVRTQNTGDEFVITIDGDSVLPDALLSITTTGQLDGPAGLAVSYAVIC